MLFTVIIDNNPHPTKKLDTEHGLSIYFEADNLKWLLDTGNSSAFIHNANMLGIKIEDIDYLVLSHGHRDHTGGLSAFLKANKKAKVILSEHIFGHTYYSFRHKSKRDITVDPEVFIKYHNRFSPIIDSQNITKNVAIVTNFNLTNPTPKANSVLFAEHNSIMKPDTFKHEIAVCFKENNSLIVFSGCAHNGLLNTIESCSQFTKIKEITSCIGGTHLNDRSDSNSFETDEEIDQIAFTLKANYPNIKFITGHCTGDNARNRFNEILGRNFYYFYSGFSDIT
jgi:7,8-dihydropterin-6-yl-methyl-4-(beta-D-ribofuranosyl)aminobenzene 5'-phosphate synthase